MMKITSHGVNHGEGGDIRPLHNYNHKGFIMLVRKITSRIGH